MGQLFGRVHRACAGGDALGALPLRTRNPCKGESFLGPVDTRLYELPSGTSKELTKSFYFPQSRFAKELARMRKEN